MRVPRPFLKWVGGKGQLLAQLAQLLPDKPVSRYYEPFVGGGALFFDLKPVIATLSDSNRELIDTYIAVRDHVDEVIAELKKHRYESEHYYEVRALDPFTLEAAARAARMIFLNKTGFNGLYRVNKAGRFNVPFGRYKNPLICDEKNLRACSAALQGVELEARDFGSEELLQAQPGDFVYFDPPYIPASRTANFTGYVAGGFGRSDQERLAEVFAKLTERGVMAMLSNSDVPAVRELYADFDITEVSATRAINSKASKRGRVGELVVRNYTP